MEEEARAGVIGERAKDHRQHEVEVKFAALSERAYAVYFCNLCSMMCKIYSMVYGLYPVV